MMQFSPALHINCTEIQGPNFKIPIDHKGFIDTYDADTAW